MAQEGQLNAELSDQFRPNFGQLSKHRSQRCLRHSCTCTNHDTVHCLRYIWYLLFPKCNELHNDEVRSMTSLCPFVSCVSKRWENKQK